MLAGFRTARATAVGEYPTRHLVGCRLAFTLKPIEGTRDLASFQKTPKLTDQNNFRGGAQESTSWVFEAPKSTRQGRTRHTLGAENQRDAPESALGLSKRISPKSLSE
jgi:hypothetical protein